MDAERIRDFVRRYLQPNEATILTVLSAKAEHHAESS
jgi:hypothetical protein